jgi:hypothetical protein
MILAIRGTQGKNVCWVRNYTVVHAEEEQLVTDTIDQPNAHHLFYDFQALAWVIRRKNEDFGAETHPWKWELVSVNAPLVIPTGVVL